MFLCAKLIIRPRAIGDEKPRNPPPTGGRLHGAVHPESEGPRALDTSDADSTPGSALADTPRNKYPSTP